MSVYDTVYALHICKANLTNGRGLRVYPHASKAQSQR